ncbi:MAG: VWA domain-containing protein [Planctomycetaceae bacterium]
MSFAFPLGLLGLLSLPAIVALHLFQRRFPRMAVAGLHLWTGHVDSRDAGPKRDRLTITPSLLLELLAAALLALVIAGPRFDSSREAQHLVIVLDDSASMATRPQGEPSLRDEALERVQKRLAELPPNSVVTVLLTGERPAMLAGPGVGPAQALATLDRWRPNQPRHDFHAAWDYAQQLADETGRMLFVTDRLPDEKTPVPNRMEVISVGMSADNVALTAARWKLTPVPGNGKDELWGIVGRLFFWVHNFSERTVTATVRGLEKDGTEVFRQELELQKNVGQKVDVRIRGGVGEMTVELKTEQHERDELVVDSRLTMIEPQLRPVKVFLNLPKTPKSARQIDKVLRLLPAVQFSDEESADLRIVPLDPLPPSREDLWWLGVGPFDPSEAARKTAKTPSDRFPFLIEREHPLLKDITLDGVRWAGVQGLTLDVVPMISAGGQVLLGKLKGTQTTGFVLNVDLERSTLEKSPDWPIFLQNLIELRRAALPGLRRWNYRRGENVVFQPPGNRNAAGGDKPLTLKHGEEQRPLARGRIVQVTSPSQDGVYEIADGDKTLGRFAVGFLDARESDLSELQPGVRPAVDDSQESGFLVDRPFSPLLLGLLALALAALIADWWVLRPRRAVTSEFAP